jgi:DNA-directed RNA polymerase subunit K/omega
MTSDDYQVDPDAEPAEPSAPGPVIADPPRSRFLFVDVAAMRAKQLRRGALARLGRDTHHPLKAERIAMEEVRKGFVGYDLPEFKVKPIAEQ